MNNYKEYILGYDGVVIAQSKNGSDIALTTKELYLALAKYLVSKDGKLVANFYKYWDEIDSRLAHAKIEIYGPAHGSGTRDTVTEAIGAYCDKQKIIITQYAREEDRVVFCSLIREDGAYIESSENDNIIISKILQNTNALGLISFNYLSSNSQKIKSVSLDGSFPTIASIKKGDYKLARPLYLYVNLDHYKQIKELESFVKDILSGDYSGPHGILTKNGLISR